MKTLKRKGEYRHYFPVYCALHLKMMMPIREIIRREPLITIPNVRNTKIRVLKRAARRSSKIIPIKRPTLSKNINLENIQFKANEYTFEKGGQHTHTLAIRVESGKINNLQKIFDFVRDYEYSHKSEKTAVAIQFS